MVKDIDDPKSVTEFIEKLDPEFGKLVESVRRLILTSDPAIGERIKWNAPSFFYTGPMQPFDPKAHKRDIAVMHLRRGFVLLILPTGARIEDDFGLLEGDYADGRRLITFRSLDDVRNKASALKAVILKWVNSIQS